MKKHLIIKCNNILLSFTISLISFWLLGFTDAVFAQEFLTGLKTNPQIIKDSKQHTGNKDEIQPLLLPFIEDFSNYTGFPDERLFVDSQAFVNQTFPVFPPTIGVVTLDALNEKGEIYPHLNATSKGADTLTSRYIRLDSLFSDGEAIKITPENSVYFSFYFQPGGAGIVGQGPENNIGNTPNVNDSLVLEFGYLLVLEDTAYTVWNHVWSTSGFNVTQWTAENPLQYFKQILIPVTDENYFSEHFQFRFRNYASLEPQPGITGWEGNVDQWHIDYIRLDVNRNDDDVFTEDLAFVHPTTSFLKKYQSMPWKQFQLTDMDTIFTNKLTNLSNGVKGGSYQFYISQNGEVVHNHIAGADNVNPYYTHGIVTNTAFASPGIDFIPDLNDTTTFKITHVFQYSAGSAMDFCVKNDTCVFEQKFSNYYAYDDGTAEYGYCLNNQYNIANLAMKYSLRVPDELSAVRMWFNHTKNDENKEATFNIVVWKDSTDSHGVSVNIPSKTKLYSLEGKKPDFAEQFLDFVEYRFDKMISVSGDIWIGFEQQGNVQLNIGFDQNNDSRDFFKYNTSGTWEKSSFKGTPMIRPVFGELSNAIPKENIDSSIVIYPNPTTGELRIENGELRIEDVEIFDIYGRKQLSTFSSQFPTLNISHFPAGVYFLKIHTENGMVTKKIIKL